MKLSSILLILVICSCSVDKEQYNGTLQALVVDNEIVLNNVIACAASNKDDVLTSIFLYPRIGASDIRYFETQSLEANKNDFSEYKEFDVHPTPIFNGYLLQIQTMVEDGKWVIVSFMENEKIHLCNPIRIKKDSKPTEYLPDNVALTNLDTNMPRFNWSDGVYDDSAIYFQVVSDSKNDLLSGTYTYEKNFRYYDTANVVLNVTRRAPPELDTKEGYKFTLMGVSEDNWVNLFAEVSFNLQEN